MSDPTTKPKRGGGGPKHLLKKHPELIGTIVQYLEQGVPIADACVLSGVSQGSYFRWMELGEQAQAKGRECVERELFEQVRAGESRLIQRNALIVTAAAKDDWRAAAWLLERKRPEVYGKQVVATISGKDGGPVPVQAMPLTLNVIVAAEKPGDETPAFVDDTAVQQTDPEDEDPNAPPKA